MTPDGNEGRAPKACLQSTSELQAVALEDYTAMELDTTQGESVTVHRELAGWVWVENAQGELGWIPGATIG